MNSGCITKSIDGNWLTNSHLSVCLLKLDSPTESEWQNDRSRVSNLSIITKLLQSSGASHQGLLAQEFSDKPSLVLAPELAFGSPDFESLDALVKQYNKNLILICGFGFTQGDKLTSLAENADVEGIWHTPPNSNKKYNGGWVWVKNGNTTHCYIFLKNFFEQQYEIAFPNLVEGDCILRLEGNDLVIFPMICADLISKEDKSPCKRIIESLNTSSSSNKQVLVTGSLLNDKSASGHWKAAIGDLLEDSKTSNVRLLLSNCKNPTPLQNEDQDKWRCLSGAYQHRQGCKPPKNPLPNLRYVDDTKFSGIVLRNPEIGATFGKLKWTNSSSEGLHAFSECSQYGWDSSEFYLRDGLCAADELYRFIVRNMGGILHNKITSNDATKTLANTELNKLLTELSPVPGSPLRAAAGELFQKCLKGIDKDISFCPDQLHSQADSLDCTITTLKLVQGAIEAKLMPKGEELDFGQLLSSDSNHEILIWGSSEYKASDLYSKVEEGIVIDGGSARVLTIIVRGNGGGMLPKDGRIKSGRLADIANSPPLNSGEDILVDQDICEARDRVVFWKNQGHIDEILSSTDISQDLIENLQREITINEDL